MSAINTNKSIRVKAQRHLDDKYFDPSTDAPYLTTADVLAKIGTNERVVDLTVNILGVEYWFHPDTSTLVNKIGSLSLVDGSVTLAKMANVDSATVFYRKTAGSGAPEVQTLATLRADLNIPADLDPVLYVLRESGYSLAPNTMIDAYPGMAAAIAALPTTYVAIAAGYSLISTTDLAKLGLLYPPVTITLPNAADVPSRIAGTVEGTDYPTGWTISATGTMNRDLLITHNLSRRVVGVSVWIHENTGDTELERDEAFNGLKTASDYNSITIQNLATVAYPLVINLMFGSIVS